MSFILCLDICLLFLFSLQPCFLKNSYIYDFHLIFASILDQPPGQICQWITSPVYQDTMHKLVVITNLIIIKILLDQYPVKLYADIGKHPCKNLFEKTVYDTSLNLKYWNMFVWISASLFQKKALLEKFKFSVGIFDSYKDTRKKKMMGGIEIGWGGTLWWGVYGYR